MSKQANIAGELPEPMETEVQERQEHEKFTLDFFRRNQKAILYTAGIFALLTFSITGAMTSAFSSLFESKRPMPTMTVPGHGAVKVTGEDYETASILKRWGAYPVMAMPVLGFDDEQRNNESHIYAALRRLAITAGIEGSRAEADRAIEQAIKVEKFSGSQAQFAFRCGFPSLTALQVAVTEALRVGTFLRLQALGIDASDPAAAEEARKEHQMLTFNVASLDKKAVEKRIKDAGIKDEELQKWLEGLGDNEKFGYQDANHVAIKAMGARTKDFDAALFAAELQGKTWGDEVILQRYDLEKDRRYKLMPESRPTTSQSGTQTQQTQQSQSMPTMPSYRPLDEALKAEIKKELQAEDAVRAVWAKVQEDMATFLRPQVDARVKAGEELAAARKQQTELEKALTEKRDKLDQKAKDAWAATEKSLKEAFDKSRQAVEDAQKIFNEAGEKLTQAQKDAWTKTQKDLNLQSEKARKAVEEARKVAALKADESSRAAHEAAKKVVEAVQKQILAGAPELKDKADALEVARKAQEGKQKELDAGPPELAAQMQAIADAKKDVEKKSDGQRDAELVVDEARKGFDALASFTKHWAQRKGLMTAVVAEPKSADGLKELAGIGKWLGSAAAISIDSDGDLATQIQRELEGYEGCFFFQVTKVERRPLKPWNDIKEKVTNDFAAKKSDEEAKEKTDKLNEALLRLGKVTQKEAVDKLEKEQSDELTKRLDKWRQELQAKAKKAQEFITANSNDQTSRAYVAWAKVASDTAKSLGEEAAQQTKVANELKTEYEKKIKDETKKAYGKILKAAADEAGFAVKSMGPFSKKLSSTPRFAERFPDDVRYVFGKSEVDTMKVGDVIDVADDTAGRAVHVAVLETSVKASLEQLTRRQILERKDSMLATRVQQGMVQSFTLDALKSRYGWHEPASDDDKKPADKK